jgi:hypothetical protein
MKTRSQNSSVRKQQRIPKPALEAFPVPVERPRPASTSTEDIRLRAYQIWEAAGKPAGDGVQFWIRAELELHQPS